MDALIKIPEDFNQTQLIILAMQVAVIAAQLCIIPLGRRKFSKTEKELIKQYRDMKNAEKEMRNRYDALLCVQKKYIECLLEIKNSFHFISGAIVGACDEDHRERMEKILVHGQEEIYKNICLCTLAFREDMHLQNEEMQFLMSGKIEITHHELDEMKKMRDLCDEPQRKKIFEEVIQKIERANTRVSAKAFS